jgi:hypothetical protein
MALLLSTAALGDCSMKVADSHSYTAGDTQWVGHTLQELHAALGEPSFSLGKPYHMVGGPDYRIDVYTAPQPASAGCIDAYKLNECGVITDYFCR